MNVETACHTCSLLNFCVHTLIPNHLSLHCQALRRQQDGGFFKSPHYPGYPFLMIPDLSNPYLTNGALSPSARAVSTIEHTVCLGTSLPFF